ncbi:MAG: VWA domain-containing protein [Phycisphaerales bacterium]|nr:VWA domain-containing protein [Phycisphaerales bacterium]
MLERVHFESPLAFLLLLLPLGLWAWRTLGSSPTAPVLFSSLALTDGVGLTVRQRMRPLLRVLRALGWLALVIALARPQSGTGQVRTKARGVAIAVAVDRSYSMSEQIDDRGEKKSRIDVVKRVFAEFVEGNRDEGGDMDGRPQDLIGLVAFSGFAETICPLVSIHDRLVELCDGLELSDGRSMESGTAIGAGLALAAARLERAEQELQEQNRRELDPDFEIKSKIIILLTDGTENIQDPPLADAARMCRELGIKVYAIGIGGGERVRNVFGMEVSRYPFSEAPLRQVAETTGGLYRGVTDGDSLRDVYEEIDRLEKTEIETVEFMNYDEVFWYFGLAAAVAFLLELLLRHTLLRSLP